MPASPVSTPRSSAHARTSPTQWLVLALIGALAVALVALTLQRDDAATAVPAAQAPAAGADGPAAPADGPVAGTVTPQGPETLDVARRDPADPLAAGPVDAPVVMVVYSDYQCPFCAVWAAQTQPTMLEYVAAGDLRIEWRDITVFGPDSERAARAAYAAGLQGAFWEFHGALFAGGEKRAAADLTEQALVDLAGSLSLDTDRFTADLASPEVAAAVQANADEAASIGAFSTPSFLIGEQAVVGAQPTEVFVAAVEDALARVAG